MKKEIVSIVVVFLFFGLAIAPSINANVNKEDDLVELDVEFCGFGRKHSVKLTQEEYNEVELIFDDIQERLSDVESDDEAVEILNEAIVKLDNYGLLGGLSVKQVQRNFYRLKQVYINVFNSPYFDNLDTSLENYNCLIIGKIEPTLSQNILGRSLYTSISLLLNFLSDNDLKP